MTKAAALSNQDFAFIGTDEQHSTKSINLKDDLVYRATAIFQNQIDLLIKCRTFCDGPTDKTVLKNDPCSTYAIQSRVRDFVQRIADRYWNTNFHSLQHATHVLQVANKLMLLAAESRNELFSNFHKSRSTVSLDSIEFETECENYYSASNGSLNNVCHRYHLEKDFEADISNPMNHFVLIFAAFIHDVDHLGVPNAVLVKERHEKAIKYQNISVAEQNSVDIAFEILDKPDFSILRKAIFLDEQEYAYFRELVREIVITTDIASSDRQKQCNERFNCVILNVGTKLKGKCQGGSNAIEKQCNAKYFDDEGGVCDKLASKRLISHPLYSATNKKKKSSSKKSQSSLSSTTATQNRKGYSKRICEQNCNSTKTFKEWELVRLSLMELMLLAADVSHCMQSWEVFLKWNTNLYHELNTAYKQGRSFDPSKNWYEGQIGFFENYIIPLSTRLKQSELFGSQGSLFVKLAVENKHRWTIEGNNICANLRKGGIDEELCNHSRNNLLEQ